MPDGYDHNAPPEVITPHHRRGTGPVRPLCVEGTAPPAPQRL